jgi:hypothetical protein
MNDTDSGIRGLFQLMLRDEPSPLSATELQCHGATISLESHEAASRLRYGRLAIAGLVAASIVAALAALNDRSTANVAGSPSASLSAAEELPLAASDVDIQTAGPHWDTAYQVPGAPPFYGGTWANAPDGSLDVCVGRGNDNSYNTGCGDESNATTHLVESSGRIDTIVWHGLPTLASYVVLQAEGITRWQPPVNSLAAFPATWCTVDVCPYTLTAYDSNGHPLVSTSN